MPRLNQEPSPGQPFPLSKEREVSHIPTGNDKDEEDKLYVYPSEQVKYFI